MFTLRYIKMFAGLWTNNIIVPSCPYPCANTVPWFPWASWIIIWIFIPFVHLRCTRQQIYMKEFQISCIAENKFIIIREVSCLIFRRIDFLPS